MPTQELDSKKIQEVDGYGSVQPNVSALTPSGTRPSSSKPSPSMGFEPAKRDVWQTTSRHEMP